MGFKCFLGFPLFTVSSMQFHWYFLYWQLLLVHNCRNLFFGNIPGHPLGRVASVWYPSLTVQVVRSWDGLTAPWTWNFWAYFGQQFFLDPLPGDWYGFLVVFRPTKFLWWFIWIPPQNIGNTRGFYQLFLIAPKTHVEISDFHLGLRPANHEFQESLSLRVFKWCLGKHRVLPKKIKKEAFLGGGNSNTPRKLTWNLKITCLKRKIIFQSSIFGFHVSFRGSIFMFIPKLGVDSHFD